MRAMLSARRDALARLPLVARERDLAEAHRRHHVRPEEPFPVEASRAGGERRGRDSSPGPPRDRRGEGVDLFVSPS